MDTTRRMTDAELDRAAAALLPTEPPLPPMRVDELIEYLIDSTRETQADLWTFRDAIDAHLTGTRHASAVAALGVLAELYDEATNTMRAKPSPLDRHLAADLEAAADAVEHRSGVG